MGMSIGICMDIRMGIFICIGMGKGMIIELSLYGKWVISMFIYLFLFVFLILLDG